MRQSIGLFVVAVFLGGIACRQTAQAPKKVPITTSSDQARAAFLKARDLVENMHTAEARPLLDEAIRLDPNFAMAHLLRAETATSTNEFFDHVKAAVAAAGKVSEGEQLLIRAQEAYANNDYEARRGYLTKLTAAYPDDERAHGLLGTHHYVLQQHDAAVAELQRAVQLAPGYAPAYNMLGYALRDAQKDKDAEAAFRKYIELIPNEPNPHDSLAELLLKMGRFQESIDSYRKALSLDPRFLSAHRGIAASLMYQQRHKEALEELQKGLDAAGNDGERRQMLRSMAVLNADEGKLTAALAMLSKESALAEKQGDQGSIAQAAFLRGDLLLNAGRAAEAAAEYAKGLQVAQGSTLPDSVKKSIEMGYHGSIALVAAAKKDFENARKEAEIMRAGVEGLGNPNEVRSAHEVLGIVALRQANYDEAIAQLNQADLSSPYTMFQMAKAYAGKKDAENAKTCYQKAANAYTLPNLRYAMVRVAAQRALR